MDCAHSINDSHTVVRHIRKNYGIGANADIYEGENETYIEASAENSGSTLYDKEIRDKPRTRHTKRNV